MKVGSTIYIPGILLIAFDLMMSSPARLRAILAAGRAGDEMAFACAVLKEWLPKLLGIDMDTGRAALALLASDINIFGLQPKFIGELLGKEEPRVREALLSIVSLGYQQQQ